MDALPKKQRVIAHIDMNSYFATVEQQDNPKWRGHPVGICEHLGGIIIAASVEAKRWGIKTGTPVWEARRIFPKIHLTQTNPQRYRYYTARFLKVFADYTDKIEKYSIDEAFLDLTDVVNVRISKNGILQQADPWEEAQEIVKQIKHRMVAEVGDYITCSAGVSYSKLVAKIASDLQKPDGLVVIRPQDKHILYDRLQLTDIPGIGSRMKKRLNGLGINTFVHLRDYPLSKLVTYFGIQGHHLHSMGQLEGSWKEGFGGIEEMKSIGHMYTVPQEYRQAKVMPQVLYKLSEMVAARLRVNELMGNGLSVHLHDAERNCSGKSAKIDYYLRDGRDIYLEAMALLMKTGDLANQENLNFYMVGVTVSGLMAEHQQDSLFESSRKKAKIMAALDKINTKYDDFTIARVPAFLAKDIIRDSIGFGRMKEFQNASVRGSHGRFG